MGVFLIEGVGESGHLELLFTFSFFVYSLCDVAKIYLVLQK